MLNSIKGLGVKAFLTQLAKGNNDKKTTVLGYTAALIIAAQIDYTKLLDGDPGEIGKAAGVVVAALWGFFTNRPDKEKVNADN